MATLKPVKQKNRVKSGHRPFSPLTLLQHVEWFTPALTFVPTCSDFWLDFTPVVRMDCEIKLLESEATTGFFVLLGEQGNKAVLGWVMKEGLIPSRYECQKCKKDMLLVERKGMIDDFEWRCRVQLKENPHFVCRSVRKGFTVRFKPVLLLSRFNMDIMIINGLEFAEARSREIASLMDTAFSKKKKKCLFQNVPNYMRRRGASRNPKRVPRPLRVQNKNSVAKTKPKKVHKSKPKDLREEYASRSKPDSTWLENHIWFAKRFKMDILWGYHIPIYSYDKKLGSTHKAAANHAMLVEDFGKRNMPGKRARRHFSQLSEFERGLIIWMKTACWSTCRVAGQVDRSECAVRNCQEQWTREGTHARINGSGATRKTMRREDRRIVRQALVDPQ
ncbi:hypothetical protein TNCV_4800241 [Trichonephila clavipes]|nr:hypothetical protein TNCV_4800241 [Trichonephila clavipes]